MKRNTLAYGLLALLVVLVAVAVLGFKPGFGGSSKKEATPADKLQGLIDKNKTDAVASAAVVRCIDRGPQTIPDETGQQISYKQIYACPVLIAMKDGSGGCVGVVVTITDTGVVAPIAASLEIDPKNCA